jgi:hypothetical protein
MNPPFGLCSGQGKEISLRHGMGIILFIGGAILVPVVFFASPLLSAIHDKSVLLYSSVPTDVTTEEWADVPGNLPGPGSPFHKTSCISDWL